MIPRHLSALFWDIDLDSFRPQAYPDYTIFRVLELGDDEAVVWMRSLFPEPEIRRVLCSEHRLSPKSANFWALIYELAPNDLPALRKEA